jgi:hypothetical protein
MAQDYNNIPAGLRLSTQIPLDVKSYIANEATLAYLGAANNLAYTYVDGMEIYCVAEKTKWVWREVEVGEENTGLVPLDFTYPANSITFGINYSSKKYNFFPATTGAAILNDLNDVTIASLANNNLLAYDLATTQWKNKTYASLGLQATITNPVTGYGTANKVPKYSNTSGALVDSNITDTGSLITIASPTNINGATNVVGATSVTGATTIKSTTTSPTNPLIVISDSLNSQYPIEIRPTQGDTRNIFIGANTGKATTTAINNTVIGCLAGTSITTGNNNTFLGYITGGVVTTAIYNTFIGSAAGIATTGSWNTFLGGGGGYNNTTGNNNVFVGYNTGNKNETGTYNTFVGNSAGAKNGEGAVASNYNTALGYAAGGNTITGNRNVYLGYDAGITLNDIVTPTGTANDSVFIGSKTKAGTSDNQTNQIVIGYNADGLGSNSTVIGNTSTTVARIHGKLDVIAGTTARAQIKLNVGVAPTTPVDGDIWLESNTNTGLKIRINGVTKTITLA